MSTPRTEAIFRSDLRKVSLWTDRMFFGLLIGQWLFAIGVAAFWSPRTWIAEYWTIHQHVLAAALLGALFAAYPIYLIIKEPGSPYTRHMIAIGQMLQSALLVHVTGGRIETHFHVFGSLALLAFYRDWKVLITASAIVYLDHLALGFWFPLSAYGVTSASVWRSLEHAAWVVFEVVFLTMACRTGIRELRSIADRQGSLEETSEQLQRANAEMKVLSQALEEANQGLEVRVRDRTFELEQVNAKLQETQYHLVQAAKMESIGRLAAGAAHEVKNPLAVLLMGVEYLTQNLSEEDGPTATVLTTMEEAVDRADSVIRGLLDFSTHRKLTLAKEPINAVIEKSLMLIKYEIEKCHIKVVASLAKDLPLVNMDCAKLEQVFVNLLMNAVQAMVSGGVLKISTCRQELSKEAATPLGAYFHEGMSVVMAQIEDHGPGIPEHLLPKIFDPFFTTKATGQGTGLGLSVSRSILDLHGAAIAINNKPDGGVRVRVFFPEQS